jgi:voltage-gated sodium channel
MMIGVILDVMQKEHEKYQLEQGEGEAAEVHWLKEHAVEMETRLERIEGLLMQSVNGITKK